MKLADIIFTLNNISKISVPASIPHNTDAQDPVGSSNLPGYLPGISENEANVSKINCVL